MATEIAVVAVEVWEKIVSAAAAGPVVFDARAVLGTVDAVWETVLKSELGFPPSFWGKVVW